MKLFIHICCLGIELSQSYVAIHTMQHDHALKEIIHRVKVIVRIHLESWYPAAQSTIGEKAVAFIFLVLSLSSGLRDRFDMTRAWYIRTVHFCSVPWQKFCRSLKKALMDLLAVSVHLGIFWLDICATEVYLLEHWQYISIFFRSLLL